MYLFFDTETTGLPIDRNAPITALSNWPRLVQIAWLLHDDQAREIEEAAAIIRPDGFIVPDEAARVHGITTERAREEGLDLRDTLLRFAEAIEGAEIIVAHNISFDEKVVGAEFLRAKVPSQLFEKERLCTMVKGTEFCQIPGPYGFKWPTLPELNYCLFQEGFEEVHDASVDVRICARCFFQLQHLGVI